MNKRQAIYHWLLVMTLSVLLFLILMLAIRMPAIQRWDIGMIQSLDPIRSAAMITFFSGLTHFGETLLLAPIMLLCMAFLFLKRHYASFFILPIAYLADRGLNGLLKNWIMRDRPAPPHLDTVSGYSFPSGHAMNAISVYGLLILILVPLIRSKRLRILWIAVCLGLILLIGFSRPFLRVHYFSDVLAGYCAGGVVVAACALVLLPFRRIPEQGGAGH